MQSNRSMQEPPGSPEHAALIEQQGDDDGYRDAAAGRLLDAQVNPGEPGSCRACYVAGYQRGAARWTSEQPTITPADAEARVTPKLRERRGIRLDQRPPADLPAAPLYEPGRVFALPICDIDPDPQQPRKHFDGAALDRLGASLQRHQEDPIVVRHTPSDNNPRCCTLVHGERRWRAAQRSGLPSLLARLDTNTAAGADLIARQAVDNLEREDLSPWDLMSMFRTLRDEHAMTPTQISDHLALFKIYYSRSQISNYLRLFGLPDWALDELRTGKLTPTHGLTLLPLTDTPAILERVHATLSPALARPTTATLEADPAAADWPTPLTVVDLKRVIDTATRASGVSLQWGGHWDPARNTGDSGGPDHLNPLHLTAEDRAACQACPSRLGDTCINPACLATLIQGRANIIAAARDQAGPPGIHLQYGGRDAAGKYLDSGRLTDADRANCVDCPHRKPGPRGDECHNPPCLSNLITTHDQARRAALEADELEREAIAAQLAAAIISRATSAAPPWAALLYLTALEAADREGDDLGSFANFLTDADAQASALEILADDWAATLTHGDDGLRAQIPEMLAWMEAPP
jgi:ParB/RepB/Spo0J family partition protein